jgi:Icc-related predicted phosphoesterase
MPSKQLTRILCAADPRGDVDAIKRLLASTAAEPGVDAVAIVGDLSEGGTRESHRAMFRALGAGGLPTFWVPGPGDAPVAHYLREAHDVGIVHPDVRGVHGTAAVAPGGHVLFAGLGGEVDDDPDVPREETERLHYPRWEAEYRLRIIGEFDGLQPVLLFSTPPAHKGLQTAGSEAVAELVATYRARLVVSGGERMTEMLGRTLIVAPGPLGDGHFAIADLHKREVTLGELAAAA